MRVSYREAVVTSSPTLPLGGYVGYSTWKRVGVAADCNPSPQGSRGGNPGLEVGTASRYLLRAS